VTNYACAAVRVSPSVGIFYSRAGSRGFERDFKRIKTNARMLRGTTVGLHYTKAG